MQHILTISKSIFLFFAGPILCLNLIISLACAQDISDYNPDITADGSGNTYVVWFAKTTGANAGTGDIYCQKLDASGTEIWPTPVQVNVSAPNWISGWELTPRILFEQNTLYVLWADRINDRLSMQKLDTNGNRLWLADRQVNVDQPPEFIGHDMAANGSGFIYIIFQRYGPAGRSSFCQKVDLDATTQWPMDVSCGQGSNQTNQEIAVSPSGYVYTSNLGSQSSLRRINPLDGNGVWFQTPIFSVYDIQTGAADEVILAGRSQDNVVAQIYFPDGTPGSAALTVSADADQPRKMSLGVTSSGAMHVSWTDGRGGAWGFDDDVYYNQLSSGGTRVFVDDVRLNRLDLSEQAEPELVLDGLGGAWVSWSQDWTAGVPAIFANQLDNAELRLAEFDILVSQADPFPFGDVNGDGNLTSIDASRAARHSVGLLTLVDATFFRADVNGDNAVTSIDASQIVRKAVGLISAFAVEP